MTVLPQKLPIGSLLKDAGLITEQQLQKALEVQGQYSKMKLGEVLVLQEGIKSKTIDFFVDRWYDLLAQGQQFPLGYYLNQAYLLNEQQITNILKEQKLNQQKFGEIAVQFGWIKQATLDFFIDSLSKSLPQQISLSSLEEYNRSKLHLEKKYADYTLILSRILAWTGGNHVLSKTISKVFANSDTNVPPGSEVKAVDQFVENSLIRKWQIAPEASYIRDIGKALVNNCRYDPRLLLQEYREILITGGKEYLSSPEQNELISLGLIFKSDSLVRVANIIYQQIFHQDYISRALKQIVSSEKSSSQSATSEMASNSSLVEQPVQDAPSQAITQNDSPASPETSVTNIESQSLDHSLTSLTTDIEDITVPNPAPAGATEPIAKLSAVVTLAVIAFLVPLFAIINNYYSSRNDPEETSQSNNSEAQELQKFCGELIAQDLNASLNQIFQLEQNQRQLGTNFPLNCQTKLDHLRVMTAPQLGRENRTTEAIRHLCKIPVSSDVYVDAEVWLKHWYDSATWGKETKFYLQEQKRYSNAGCPAANFLENQS